MKKFSLLFLSMVIAVAAQGAPQFKASHTIKSKAVITNKMVTKPEVKGDMRNAVVKTKDGILRAPVTEQPEGEVVQYTRAGQCMYVSSGNIGMGAESGIVTVVKADDGKVYIQNLLYGSGNYYGNAWVEGTIEGNKLKVPMEQSIYWDDDYQADVVLSWGSTSISYNDEGNPVLNFTPDPDVTEATFTIDEAANTISLDGGVGNFEAEFPDNFVATGLGTRWTDDDSFGGFMAINTVFTYMDPSDLPTVITEQPEGDLYSYHRTGACIANSFFGISLNEQDGKINVVLNGDKAYIQNPLWYHDGLGTWVAGTYDAATGIITIPTGQYISYYSDYSYGVQVMWGETTVTQSGTDEETGEPTYSLGYTVLDEDNIQFQIDGDKLTLLNCKGDINAEFPDNYVATGIMGMYSDDLSMTCLEFNTVGEIVNLVPAVPADPTADSWSDCGDESGYSRFGFTLPTTDVDGNMLDPEFVSYSIFTDDDQLFTFSADVYTEDLTEDITEVPYSIYDGGWDFYSGAVYFYRTNAEGYEPLFKENIGIQVYYTVDGIRNASNIVYLYDKPEEAKYYVVGGFNGWNANEPLEITDEGATFDVVEDPEDVESKEFKILTPGLDNWIWLGGIDNNNVGYFEVTEGMMTAGTEIELYADDETTPHYANFRLPGSGNYTITLAKEAKGLYEGAKIVVKQNNTVPTAVNDINAKTVAGIKYVNVAGIESNKPFDGVNIVVTTYTDGTKAVKKVLR
jgi:hypothetical protein